MPDTTPSRPAMTMREIRDRLGHTRPDTTPTTPAVWSEGDPLHQALAAAVWEQCRTENTIVVDDPRSIAAVAAAAARLVLGTTDQQPAVDPADDLPAPCKGCGEPWHKRHTCTTDQPDTAPTDRRARYAAAIRDEVRLRLGTNALALAERGQPVQMNYSEADTGAAAVMAVADAEQQELRYEVEGLRAELSRRAPLLAYHVTENMRLRDEVGRLPVDRAAVLREGADAHGGESWPRLAPAIEQLAHRAEQAEAAVEGVRALATVWDDAPDPLAQAMARDLRTTLDQP
ncbi:hypothetical protein [Streptomyces sp. NPDC088730]|uniref:hypothetical protein n=1 Tax=Streptomyces sp. NPDC088730 TaxID=3365877 RepID=UPI003829BC8C